VLFVGDVGVSQTAVSPTDGQVYPLAGVTDGGIDGVAGGVRLPDFGLAEVDIYPSEAAEVETVDGPS